VSRFAASWKLTVSMYRTLLERGRLKAAEGNVSVRVPGEALLRFESVLTSVEGF
jgi:hypothetical protein